MWRVNMCMLWRQAKQHTKTHDYCATQTAGVIREQLNHRKHAPKYQRTCQFEVHILAEYSRKIQFSSQRCGPQMASQVQNSLDNVTQYMT